MRLALLAACCTLVVFAAVNVTASAAFVAHWRLRRAAWLRRPASGLLVARSVPAVLATAVALLTVLPSFLTHEPRDRVEAVGVPLAIGAALGAAIVLAAAARGLLALRRTSAALRRWRRDAVVTHLDGWHGAVWLVDSDEIDVCVVGLLRPVLLVSRRVLGECTAEELDGIVAHERSHAAARDVWKKLLLRGLPDVVGLSPVGREVERVWDALAEEEADLAAARGDRAVGVEIAAALVKVAGRRLRVAAPLATAFDAGGPIERRVRLLLAGAAPAPDTAGRRWAALGAGVLLPAALAGTAPPLSSSVHLLLEAIVRALA